jgi:hypothetical protein
MRNQCHRFKQRFQSNALLRLEEGRGALLLPRLWQSLSLHRAGTPPRYPRLHGEEPAKMILADESREWPSGSRLNLTRVSLLK